MSSPPLMGGARGGWFKQSSPPPDLPHQGGGTHVIFIRGEGFTLIEMLFVLVILGIILGISTPPFLKMASVIKLNRAADDIASVIRNTRSISIAEHREHSLNFNIDVVPNEFWISDETGALKIGKYFLPTNIVITNTTFTDNKIVFNKLGRASQEEGEIYIEDNFKRKMKITLLGLTGTVKVEGL